MLIDSILVLLGITASSLSIFLGFKFWRIEHDLARPIALMAWGGGIAGTATVIFSIASLAGAYAALPTPIVHGLRFLIFIPLTGADIYMLRKFRQIERGDG